MLHGSKQNLRVCVQITDCYYFYFRLSTIVVYFQLSIFQFGLQKSALQFQYSAFNVQCHRVCWVYLKGLFGFAGQLTSTSLTWFCRIYVFFAITVQLLVLGFFVLQGGTCPREQFDQRTSVYICRENTHFNSTQISALHVVSF